MRPLMIAFVVLGLVGIGQSLESCPCKVTPSTAFPGTSIVDCMERNLSKMPTQCFDETVSEIDISFNDIRAIRSSDLEYAPHLRLLYADFIGLKFIDEAAFSQVPKLNRLSLVGNKELYLLEGVFRGLHNLTFLSLRGSLIQRLPDLSDITQAVHMDFRHTELSYLRRPSFSKFTAHNTLVSFSLNQLTDVALDILLGFPKITVFNFDYDVVLWAQSEEERRLALAQQWDLNISWDRVMVCGVDGYPSDPGMCDE